MNTIKNNEVFKNIMLFVNKSFHNEIFEKNIHLSKETLIEILEEFSKVIIEKYSYELKYCDKDITYPELMKILNRMNRDYHKLLRRISDFSKDKEHDFEKRLKIFLEDIR